MSSRGQVLRKKRLTRSARADLLFPVSRVQRYLKKACLNRRVGVAASVYLSAVLEYLVAEVVELGGNAAAHNKRRIITPRHLLLAMANDTELSSLLRGVTISQGGVLPHINEVLLQRKKQSSKTVKPNPVPAPKPSVTAPTKRRPIASKKSKSQPVSSSGRPVSNVTGSSSVSKKGFTTLSERRIVGGGQMLTVVQGDIASIQCDAIVHPTNGSLSLSGQCGSALSSAGGSSFRTEVNKVSSGTSLSVGDAIISGSGALPSKHVIHVHSPSWNDSNSISTLTTAVLKCLSVAEDNKLKSIGFPSIASGSNGFPKQTAAQTILRAISNYYLAFKGSVEQIYFVLYDMESIGVYTSELARLDM